MTEKQILRRELLSFLSSFPKELKNQGPGFAGKLAVQLGNALLALSCSIERDEPQLTQPLEESPQSLYALGKQFRDVGLEIWESPAPLEANPWSAINDNFAAIQKLQEQVLEIAQKGSRKGGKR